MLPKKHRLTRREDFSLVYSRGSYAAADGISIKYLKNGLQDTRIGFSVGKNYSKKATERNRARRILRVACLSSLETLEQGYDIVVMIRPGKEKLEKAVNASLFEKLFRKAGLIRKSLNISEQKK